MYVGSSCSDASSSSSTLLKAFHIICGYYGPLVSKIDDMHDK